MNDTLDQYYVLAHLLAYIRILEDYIYHQTAKYVSQKQAFSAGQAGINFFMYFGSLEPNLESVSVNMR